MNWGHKLFIGFSMFVIFVIGMVYVAMKEDVGVLDKDYYARELAYQSVIDGKNNLNKLSESVVIDVNDTFITIHIPDSASVQFTDGKARFIRSADASKDLELPLILDANQTMQIPANKFIDGVYRLHLSWKSNQVNYYYERDVYI